ncbi:hypothetical protein Pla175_41370 [Pirellulimonas nuda]|uniref:Uncharacterized protein n=1 Tax=Pirellulimonas nuda TaxID=2528009 RepID=A0A518DGY3_9BACT|nr:hypothetical protein [Pirellulimonas nuda]QDU90726.1 hypothetical protein Pla175_41370 [Pirellulimonas nuda]
MQKVIVASPLHCAAAALTMIVTSGCGAAITPTSDPVQVTIKVTAKGQPVKNVAMTLQPLVGGGQAVGDVVNGQLVASVVPGTYTYYVDRGKQPADLKAIPEAYRTGALDRRLEIKQAGTYEVSLN